MGDDGIVQVNGVHYVPNHPVGVERRFVGGEPGQPLVQPFLPGSSYLVNQFLVGGMALIPGLPFQFIQELAQHQLGVAHHRVMALVVLVNVGVGIGGVDDGLARRDGGGEVALDEAAPDTKYQVGAGQKAVHRPGLAGAADAQGQGMVFREGAFTFQGSHHRHLQKLGQLH